LLQHGCIHHCHRLPQGKHQQDAVTLMSHGSILLAVRGPQLTFNLEVGKPGGQAASGGGNWQLVKWMWAVSNVLPVPLCCAMSGCCC
jgi:hypothetical protein